MRISGKKASSTRTACTTMTLAMAAKSGLLNSTPKSRMPEDFISSSTKPSVPLSKIETP